MSYQVLARKWRPQDFASLVGQEPIVTALRNALTEGRIAQAYLFSGIRGVGKTTAARVLAKALNCEKGPAADPCNDCVICREITVGSDMDVVEVDAATYSKVEQVRELAENLRYAPARDRYKVVVLDEVHRLSRQAFDALLKIVEEPPAHLVFIFATTEIDAVPATILSRCHEFQFRRVPGPVLATHLRSICDAEGIRASDAALRMLARAGEGSVRDAVALLDQLATFGGGELRDEDAKDLLGGLDAEIFHRLLAAVLTGDGAAVVAQVREIEANGWDPHNVYGQFLAYARDALHLALGGDPGGLDLPLEEAERLASLVKATRYENLLRLGQLLLLSEQVVRRSEHPLLALEIAWLRAAELPKLVRVEELLAGEGSSALRAAPAPAARAAPPPPVHRPAAPSPPQRTAPSRAVADRPPAPSATSAAAGDAAGRILETLAERRPSLAAQLRAAERLEVDGEVLVVRAAPGDTLLAPALERAPNREALEGVLRDLGGPALRWRIERGSGAPPADPSRGGGEVVGVAGLAEVREHPAVQAVLDIFKGTIAGAEPIPREGD